MQAKFSNSGTALEDQTMEGSRSNNTIQEETELPKIVYHNGSTRLILGSKDDPIPPRGPKHKSKSMKCAHCAWSTLWARKHPNVFTTMKRFYVREKNEWIPIGWYCEECGSVVIDRLKIRDRRFPVPEPVVTVLHKEYQKSTWLF